MGEEHKYYMVEASALPEVLIKTVRAKEHLASGRAKTVNEAASLAEISRSAFYKYKDLISPFRDMSAGRIITFNMLLRDKPGVLSGILAHFASHGANILTIHQSIPDGGRAPVTISADTAGLEFSTDQFIEQAMQIEGVISFEPLAGQ